MKKLYINKTLANNKLSIKFMAFVVLFIGGLINSYSQVAVDFEPRTSVYTVKGDFTMLGNTNLTLFNYSNNGTNDGVMIYVDEDGNPDTWNSSSSTLGFSTENGALPECSNVVFAGLYWFGRADVGTDGSQYFVTATKDGNTRTFDKRKVLLNGPGTDGYEEIQANTISGNDEIYFPYGVDQNIYTAYADITNYVKDINTGGVGEYFVADMALREGSSDQNGLSGGWGMVIVYENSKMNWRDITVFDGHAFVGGNGPAETFSFDVDGFNAALAGDVNIKLGVMASEGERNFTSDYLEIEIQNTGAYQRLTHGATNSDSNFFTSSISTGGNARNPSLFNNTGVDILMFDIPNPGNTIIDNGQSETSFRYGSSSDGYAIFNLTFAVDAYVPEPVGVLTNTTINGVPNPANSTVEPGGNADFQIQLTNRGTETITSTALTIPIPTNIDAGSLTFNEVINYAPSADYSAPVYDPDTNLGPNGAIVWNLGTFPLPANPDEVLAEISFTLTVTEECSIFNDPSFEPTVSTNGFISGTGEISGISFNTPLITGYEQIGNCIGEPIPAPIIIDIDYLSYVTAPPTADTPTPINVQCQTDVPDPDISVVTNASSNSGGPPSIAFVGDVSDGNTCPEVITRTYSVTDDCGNTIFVEQIITINITTPLTIADADGSSTVECIANATETFTLPTVTDACGNTLIPATAVITESPAPLTCEGTRTYTYTYTDCAGNSSDWAYVYTVDLLSFTLPANGTEVVDNLADAIEPTPPAVNDNCNNLIVPTGPTVSTLPSCQGAIVYTFTYTDCAGNTADWTYTYTLQLATFTAPDDDASTVNCIADAIAPTPPAVTDSNGTNIAPSAPAITESPNPLTCEGTRTYTYTYTDCAGNSDDWAYTYTIDTPTFTIADADGASTVECISNAIETFTLPTVTDACGNTLAPATAVITESPDPLTCEGTRTYTYTYTDCAGNSDNWTYVFTIDIPTFTIADTDGAITVECIADATETFTLPTVTDACGNTLTASAAVITESPDPLICEGTRTYTYTYTDCAGNSSDWAYTYTIKDTTPPELTLPANATAECSDDLSPIDFGTATATDNCDANPTVTFNDVKTDGPCSGTYTITRTWTTTDICGNTVSANQIISTSDTTAPVFDQATLPDNVVVECGNVPDAEMPTATDNCGIAIVTVEDVREDGNCDNNYTIKRTYTATDDCDLTNTHIQTIMVQDTIPPTFVDPLPEANIVVECDAVPVPEIITATDSCSNVTVSVSDTRTNGNCENNYILARTWIAVDDCDNTTSYTQIITVQDTKAPEFVETLPRDTTVECDAIPEVTNITATDNCGDAVVSVKDVRTDGNCPSNYIIARTWIATDECGLTTSHTQTITVQDTTAPVPSSDFETTIDVSCTDIPDAPDIKFTDNCSTNVIVEFNESSTFDDIALRDYQIIRTWTVRDACNNEETYTQTLNVTLDEIFSEISAQDRCFEEGIVNLNNFLPNTLNSDGEWIMIEGNPDASLNGSLFNPTILELSEDFLPGDGGIDYKFRYTTTDMGCISVTEVIMNIHADCVVLPCGENDIAISKAITPNGDGYNDTFDIAGIDLCGFVAEVKVFNRWGALVYESNNYTLGSIKTSGAKGDWDGSSPGSSIGSAGKLPNGTYYFIISLKNSGLSPLTGPVYLGTK